MAIRMSGLASGMDTESMVTELMKAQNLKKTKIKNKITTTEWKQDKWKDLNSKIYSFYTGALSKMKMQGSFGTKKATVSDDSKVTVTAGNTSASGAQSLKINQLASAQIVTGDKIAGTNAVASDTKLTTLGLSLDTTITASSGTKTDTLKIDANSTIGSVIQTFKNVGLNANYDATQRRFFISSKNSGSANSFDIATSNEADLGLLGLNTIKKQTDGTFTKGTVADMKMVDPLDSKIVLNGAEIISSSNVVTANGLTFTLKGVTDGSATPLNDADDKEVKISVTNDSQAVYDMVKGFIKSYNELLKEMGTDYNADSSKGYEPLTDDQKSSMTDDQIKQWESKIKDSLLRRDDNISSLIDIFRSNINGSVKVNNKSYSLASFGIGSTSYTEEGQLHIDGDADDSLTAAKTNKLMNAINNDPDTVAAVMNDLANDLYTSLSKSMTSSSLRSALTIYNDKEMKKQVTDYKKDLSKLETKLSDMENKYYKQFSAMEKAMSKMNSQSSSLSSMLGTK